MEDQTKNIPKADEVIIIQDGNEVIIKESDLKLKENEVLVRRRGINRVMLESEVVLGENEMFVTRSGVRMVVSDRRKKPTPFLSRYTFWGRRKTARRAWDLQKNYYVDRLGGSYWLVIGVILVLSTIDGFFTFHHLKHGYQEMNPLLSRFVFSNIWFMIVKYLLTVSGIVAIVLHKNFTLIKELIAVIVLMYLILNGYQVVLYLKINS